MDRSSEKERLRILQGRIAELEKANKVKTEFLSVISHALRTPLSMIMGYASMVQDRVLGEINPEQKKCMAKALRYCNDLLTIINSISEATQIEAGSVVVEKQRVDLNGFLDELKSLYCIPLDKEPALAWDYPPDLPVIKTDRGKLKQILQNLINNAIKFTGKGRVAISARRLPSRASVEFKVAETGGGISHEALPLIFDMFGQINSPDMKVYGSIGLGLHIVKSFTEMLGGKVELESGPDRGSTFTVTIPLEKK